MIFWVSDTLCGQRRGAYRRFMGDFGHQASKIHTDRALKAKERVVLESAESANTSHGVAFEVCQDLQITRYVYSLFELLYISNSTVKMHLYVNYLEMILFVFTSKLLRLMSYLLN